MNQMQEFSQQTRQLSIYDNLFKFIVVFFWIISWSTSMVEMPNQLEYFLFFSYNIFTFWYIISYILTIKLKNISIAKIIIDYRITTVLAFFFASLKYFIFPTSIICIVLTVLFLFIHIYFSARKVVRYKLEEGVVGIISSLLILSLMTFY
ncbi:MAG TPA: hypothetical protein VLM81_04695 [Peptostreptococcaceae bacterium]|nr:hypothetical protein [Peptostreptococcaceae bacterium]